MKKIILSILGGLYIFTLVFITTCLLSYNEYKVTEFGGTSFVIIKENIENHKKGQFVILKKDTLNDLSSLENVMYYDTYQNEIKLAVSKVLSKQEVTENEYVYNLESDKYISENYVIGSSDDAIKIPLLGSILNIFMSKIGYLVLMLPIVSILIYQIYKEFSKKRK